MTRTVHNRQFLTTPSPVVNQVLLYCVFRAANALGIAVHAISVESNHLHIVLTDHEGELSAFMQRMCRSVACCLLEYYGELDPRQYLEGVWSRNPFNATALLNQNAVIDKVLYTLTNPVKDGMVPDYRKWPGLSSRPGDWAKAERRVERPEYFFDQEDRDTADIPYRFTVPPMLADLPLEGTIKDMQAMLRERQAGIRAEMAAQGRRFMGVAAVLATNPFDSPHSVRPKGKVSPIVAAGGDRELLREGIRLVRGFRDAYRAAWRDYKAGIAAVFPAGTLLMRYRHKVSCDELCPPWCAAATASG